MPWVTEVKQPWKMIPHKWIGQFGFQVCSNCGLVRLNNEFTQWAIEHGCDNRNHPGYAAQHAKSGIDPLKEKK